jgi:hypothetical protein
MSSSAAANDWGTERMVMQAARMSSLTGDFGVTTAAIKQFAGERRP